MQIAGKNIVITGAGSGIGAAMARRFAAEGAASLTLADLDGDAVERVAAGLECRTLALRVDVGDEEQVRAMIGRAGEYGPVDLVCSNAGIGTGAGLEATPEQWASAWAVNVQAHVYAARAALPGMVERGGGYLLNTCSAAGLLTQPGDAPYAVTKHAAVAFAEWLALTYGEQGVGVSALCPQGVRTPLLAEALEGVAGRVVAAAGSVLEPDDVAEVVVEGLAAERFLILPHPEVAEFERRKATDRDRWLAGLRRMVSAVRG
ncbi:SDR family oxidoreductase [Actinoallomurus spadix]|uniref:SDR family NAD(P)-dependent oxidoreductase n=1 Tax=Actinoallomurus spadix TaxID=79912 RepID=A0ABN0WGY9_9ACTN|nr:SDR family oxidoreductase [Actinoallomurus spadix]MCO5989355.1 SDR family oxidoreductase [Actinoallomurus spadix]